MTREEVWVRGHGENEGGGEREGLGLVGMFGRDFGREESSACGELSGIGEGEDVGRGDGGVAVEEEVRVVEAVEEEVGGGGGEVEKQSKEEQGFHGKGRVWFDKGWFVGF